MKKRQRGIDRKFKAAVKRFGSELTLFERCGRWFFGEAFDPKKLRAAINRYLEKGFIAHWLRQLIYCGTYRKIPV
jgi:hypothetical protein